MNEACHSCVANRQFENLTGLGHGPHRSTTYSSTELFTAALMPLKRVIWHHRTQSFGKEPIIATSRPVCRTSRSLLDSLTMLFRLITRRRRGTGLCPGAIRQPKRPANRHRHPANYHTLSQSDDSQCGLTWILVTPGHLSHVHLKAFVSNWVAKRLEPVRLPKLHTVN